MLNAGTWRLIRHYSCPQGTLSTQVQEDRQAKNRDADDCGWGEHETSQPEAGAQDTCSVNPPQANALTGRT